MKRILLVVMALALALSLCLAAPALAASTTTPPKSICLSDGSYYYSLAIKLNGTVNMSGVPVKFYAITGELFNPPGQTAWGCPVTGTDHVNPSDHTFHFSLTGNSVSTGSLYTHLMEGKWNLQTLTGTCTWRQITESSPGSDKTHTLSAVDCSNNTIPYDAQGE
jgi:hypothetical protein